MSTTLLVNSALGQKVPLGALYNACKDIFTGYSLVENLPDEAIESEANHEKLFERTQTDTVKDKLAKLGVSTNLGVSLLSGLCKARGSGAYVAYNRLSNSTQQAAGICSVKTRKDNLIITEDALGTFVNLENLEAATDATHVVVGVQLGARAVVSFRDKAPAVDSTPAPMVSGVDRKKEIKQFLDHIGQIFTAEDANGPINDERATELAKLASEWDVKVNSDITVSGVKTVNYQGICQFVKKFGTSIEAAEASDTYGSQCISFDLMPINEFLAEIHQEGVAAMYEPIENASLEKVVDIFETANSIKRDFNDHLVTCKAHPDSVPQDYLVRLKKRVLDPKYEKLLMSTIGNAVSSVRGDSTSSDLDDAIKYYTSGKFAISKETVELKTYEAKMAFVDQARAAGAHMVNAASFDTIDSLEIDGGNKDKGTATATTNKSFYVLYLSAASTSKPSWEANKKEVLELLGDSTCIVAIVDCDMLILPPMLKVVAPCIQLRRSGKIILPDVVADNKDLSDKCLVRCGLTVPGPSKPDMPVPLEKRRPVLMGCPNAGCPRVESMWLCPKCKEQVTFGYAQDKKKNDKAAEIPDNNLYCSCGAYDIEYAEFKCNNKVYHTDYIKHPGGKSKLREVLLTMKPFQQFNMIILGETGAGKSTFINAFINYLLYDTLQDALDAENLTYAVPGYFQFPDPKITDRRVEIMFGNENSAEKMSKSGQSATQSTVSYVVNINGKLIRLIDTPGLGDTRGLDQDYKNVADIIQTLESVDSLSAIMFLMNNNVTRLTPSFDFVLSELMNHLHKDTAKNIIFGFTYGREAKFQIGNALVPLTELLALRNLPIQTLTSDQNAFVFDSEGFRYVAAWHQAHELMPNKADVSETWDKSAEVTRKLVNVVLGLHVHDVQQTLSLERNRRLVAGMSQNMVDLTRAIQKTRSDIDIQLAEIEDLKAKGLLAKAKLTSTQTTLVQEKLDYPRTVCCGPGCSENKYDESIGMSSLVYVKSCHDPCSVQTAESAYGVPELGGCQCFAKAGSDCNVCKHGFGQHCHISYRQVFKTQIVTHEKFAKEGRELQTKEEEVAGFVKAEEERGARLAKEEAQIKSALARFSVYLAANSITAYNDGVLKHLDLLIGAAKISAKDADLCKRYMEERVAHENHINQIKAAISSNTDQIPDAKEIDQIFEGLKNMPENDKSFRELLVQNAELPTHIAVPIKVSKTGS